MAPLTFLFLTQQKDSGLESLESAVSPMFFLSIVSWWFCFASNLLTAVGWEYLVFEM